MSESETSLHKTDLQGRVAIVPLIAPEHRLPFDRRRRREKDRLWGLENGHGSRDHEDRTVSEIQTAGGRAIGVMADVSEPAQVARLAEEAVAAFGPVDIAVSNVGRRLHKPFEDISVEDWDWAIRTNLSSCFYLAHQVVPSMRERGWGRLIHISGYDGFTGHLINRAYNIAAKAGMHGFSKALARKLRTSQDHGQHGVRPTIETERCWDRSAKAIYEGVKRSIPVRRWGHVDDIAYACLYLCTTGSFVMTARQST